MNKKEITEIFSLFMMAYPSAEIFKGGKEKLGPTIMFWADQFSGVDFKTGVEAAKQLCKTSKYPPTQAEYAEQIKKLHIKQQPVSVQDLWAKLMDTTKQVADLMTEFGYTLVPDGSVKTQGQIAREQTMEIYEQLNRELKTYLGSYSGMLQFVREFNPHNQTGVSITHRDFERSLADADYQLDELEEANKHVIGYNGYLPITE